MESPETKRRFKLRRDVKLLAFNRCTFQIVLTLKHVTTLVAMAIPVTKSFDLDEADKSFVLAENLLLYELQTID